MITLQFSTAKTLGAWAIRAFEQGAGFSHVDAVLDGGLLGARDDKIGDIPPGVQVRPRNYEPWTKTLIVELPASDQMTEDFEWALMHELSKPYDASAIEAFLLDRNWREPDSWFCSELQGATLEKCGWFGFPLSTPSNKLTPDGLLLAISAKQKITLT